MLASFLEAQDINYNVLAKKVDSIFKKQEAQGMQLILVKSDSILLKEYYGINPKTSQPVNEQTLYLLNAITELFTALVLLNLLESKQISIDTELKEIAPEISFDNEWEDEYPIRIRHLIAHTTGWQKGHFYHFLLDRNKLSLEEIVFNYPQSRVSQYPPGQYYQHSNDGYALAGYLIEKISGMSYEQYITKHILIPLGMSSSSFNSEAPDLAVKKNSPTPYPSMTERPSDGMVTNSTDMGKFLQFLHNEGKMDSIEIINPSIISQVMASSNTLFDVESNTIAQGYGFYKMIYRGTEIILVKGSDVQFTAQLILIPAYKLGVFYALSGDEASRIEVLNYLLNEHISSKNQVEHQQAELGKDWLGYYQYFGYSFKIERFINNLFGVVHISELDGKLYYNNLFETPQPMFRGSQDNIFIKNRNFEIGYTLAKDLENNTVLLNANGEKFQKTSGVMVWTKIILTFAFLLGLISLPIVGLSRVVLRILRKKSMTVNNSLRLFQLSFIPLLLIIILILSLIPNEPIDGIQSMKNFASISFHSIALFGLSLSFGIIGLLAIVSTVRSLKSKMNIYIKGYLVFLATIYFISICYLTFYEIIGIRGWTM